MATPEPTTGMTPLDYLKQADREMAAGNGRKAAALLWKATETIFLQLAKKRSLDLDELTRDYMDRIDPVWKRRFESWPAPMDYSDQVDPAWNLELEPALRRPHPVGQSSGNGRLCPCLVL